MTGQDRDILPPLSRAAFLADQFLNYVLNGDLWLEAARWLEDDDHRDGSGWHIPARPGWCSFSSRRRLAAVRMPKYSDRAVATTVELREGGVDLAGRQRG